MKQALIEALKEAGRVVTIAVVPILIDSLSQNMVDWRAVIIAGVIALLRFIDKLAHESSKDSPDALVSKLKLPF
jgi:hypothetical protein